MPKILICEKVDPVCSRIFQDCGCEVEVRTDLSPEDLAAVIGEYDGLVVRSATRVTAELMAKGTRLKAVGRAGAGVDTIDVDAAGKADIAVLNTPGQNANGVAELAVGLMFALVRHLVEANVSMRAGRWEKKRFSGTELLGKTLGLVGFGAIGRRVGAIARGIGMKVLAYDPLLNDEQIKAGGAEPVDLDGLLAGSDFVSLHLPKTPETVNLIDAAAIEKMKPGSHLINCARGGLVDEAALAEALTSGRLAGAALDVFAVEPPPADHPLLALENCLVTPHLGASTEESQVNVAASIAEQMVDFFRRG